MLLSNVIHAVWGNKLDFPQPKSCRLVQKTVVLSEDNDYVIDYSNIFPCCWSLAGVCTCRIFAGTTTNNRRYYLFTAKGIQLLCLETTEHIVPMARKLHRRRKWSWIPHKITVSSHVHFVGTASPIVANDCIDLRWHYFRYKNLNAVVHKSSLFACSTPFHANFACICSYDP